MTIQAQPQGTHLLDSTLTLQERIAAGNERIAAKAAAKIAARQAGIVPELPPAPEFYFFHPSKGLIDDPFSRQGAAPAPAPTSPAPAPAPRLAPTPTPRAHAPSHVGGDYGPGSSVRSVRPGYPMQQPYTQQGYVQQSFPGGYQGAQQVAQGGYAPHAGYESYARQPAYGGQPAYGQPQGQQQQNQLNR